MLSPHKSHIALPRRLWRTWKGKWGLKKHRDVSPPFWESVELLQTTLPLTAYLSLSFEEAIYGILPWAGTCHPFTPYMLPFQLIGTDTSNELVQTVVYRFANLQGTKPSNWEEIPPVTGPSASNMSPKHLHPRVSSTDDYWSLHWGKLSMNIAPIWFQSDLFPDVSRCIETWWSLTVFHCVSLCCNWVTIPDMKQHHLLAWICLASLLPSHVAWWHPVGNKCSWNFPGIPTWKLWDSVDLDISWHILTTPTAWLAHLNIYHNSTLRSSQACSTAYDDKAIPACDRADLAQGTVPGRDEKESLHFTKSTYSCWIKLNSTHKLL